LVSGSAEERQIAVGEIIGSNRSRIVLCSMQYRQGVQQTVNYFLANDYALYVHWLNPGYHDPAPTQGDPLRIVDTILGDTESMLGIRDGRVAADDRVREMHDFIFGWASSRLLVRPPVALDPQLGRVA
jgi:hypothetical protein